MISEPVRIRVNGPWACFTRPEFKVERVSYPVITPSAARGVLEAILMKPIEKPEADKREDKTGFRWRVLRLGIVKEGILVPLLRNELKTDKIAYSGKASLPVNISDGESSRTQRHSLVLKDVEYLIEAVIEVPPQVQKFSREFLIAKYHKMFLRRAEKGQCYHRPYLGCREFSCDFELAPEAEPPVLNKDFGRMLRDFDFDPMWGHWRIGEPRPTKWELDKERISPIPRSFRAKAENGWIRVARIVSNDGKPDVEELC
jgi:CRISPR-associated protein Cas5d